LPRGRGRGGGRRGRTRVGNELADEVDDAAPKVRRRRRGDDDDDTDGNGDRDKTPETDDVTYTTGEKLSPSAKKAMRGLEDLQDTSARDAILARGGNASAFREVRSDYLDKPVGELAKLAARGDDEAVTALKLVKQASSKAQKYRGKS
jgi:hypothetical protein